MRLSLDLATAILAVTGFAAAQQTINADLPSLLSESKLLGPEDSAAVSEAVMNASRDILRSTSGELIKNMLSADATRATNAAMLFTSAVRRPDGRQIFSPFVGKLLETLHTSNFAAHGLALWALSQLEPLPAHEIAPALETYIQFGHTGATARARSNPVTSGVVPPPRSCSWNTPATTRQPRGQSPPF